MLTTENDIKRELKEFFKTKRNTRVVDLSSETVGVLYWGSAVAVLSKSPTCTVRVTLDKCGYMTVTTKRRMNEVLRVMGFDWRVVQNNFDWYLYYPFDEWYYPFIDGIGLNDDQIPVLPGSSMSIVGHYANPIVAGTHGKHVGQQFAAGALTQRYCEHLEDEAKAEFIESMDILRLGPDNPDYNQAWLYVLETAKVRSHSDQWFELYASSDGTLWQVREDCPSVILNAIEGD